MAARPYSARRPVPSEQTHLRKCERCWQGKVRNDGLADTAGSTSTATLPAPQGLSCDHHGIVSPMGLTALWQIGDTYRTILTNESAIELPTRTVDGAAWVPAGEPGLFRLVAKPTRQVMTFQQRDPTTYTDDSPSVPFLTEGRV